MKESTLTKLILGIIFLSWGFVSFTSYILIGAGGFSIVNNLIGNLYLIFGIGSAIIGIIMFIYYFIDYSKIVNDK